VPNVVDYYDQLHPKRSSLPCRFCGELNPRNSYCCVHCFKVLRAKPKSIWRIEIPSSISIAIVLVAATIAGTLLMSKYVDSFEAQIANDNTDARYNVAQKLQKHQMFNHLSTTRARVDVPEE
jgi:hypothetical protein